LNSDRAVLDYSESFQSTLDKGAITTLPEYISLQQSLHKAASQTLPGSLKKCTYPSISSQQLYSCSQCPDTALCYPCYVMCHPTSHPLEHLFSKRGIACDCGIGGRPACSLSPEKTGMDPNTENVYNHNFNARYCVCDGVYNEDSDVMYQCLFCEDWFHHGCVSTTPEGWGEEGEFGCMECCKKQGWIWAYEGDLFTAEIFVDDGLQPSSKRQKTSHGDECPVTGLEPTPREPAYLFFKEGWRSSICKCESCRKFHETNLTTFLTIDDDSLTIDDDEEPQDLDVQTSAVLSSLHRETAIESVAAYTEMKEELSSFLKVIADEGRAVSEEDIKRFFEDLKAKKGVY